VTQRLATGGILRRPNPDNPGGSVAGYAGAVLTCESFNAKLRDPLPNGEPFNSLAEAKAVIES
jgi:hypothetical protein